MRATTRLEKSRRSKHSASQLPDELGGVILVTALCRTSCADRSSRLRTGLAEQDADTGHDETLAGRPDGDVWAAAQSGNVGEFPSLTDEDVHAGVAFAAEAAADDVPAPAPRAAGAGRCRRC